MVTLDPLQTRVTWSSTRDPLIPWTARVKDQTWSVRINDFPQEHLYTLLIGDQELESFDAWPTLWSKLGPAGKVAGRARRETAAPEILNTRRTASRRRKSGS